MDESEYKQQFAIEDVRLEAIIGAILGIFSSQSTEDQRYIQDQVNDRLNKTIRKREPSPQVLALYADDPEAQERLRAAYRDNTFERVGDVIQLRREG